MVDTSSLAWKVIDSPSWSFMLRSAPGVVYLVSLGHLMSLWATDELVSLLRSAVEGSCPPAVLADWIEDNPELVRLREGDVVGLLRECW